MLLVTPAPGQGKRTRWQKAASIVWSGCIPTTPRRSTPLQANRLDKSGISAAKRERPALAASFEALANRGLAWLQCEAVAHMDRQMEKPEMLLASFCIDLTRDARWQFSA